MLSLDQSYLQRLVESSPDIIIAVDRDGTIVFYNDGARKSLRYSSAEIVGQKVTAIYLSLDEARRVMKAMRESRDAGRISSFETVLRSKDGDLIPVAISGSIIYDQSGAETGSIGFARDIRLMRQREQLATAGEIAVSLAHEINNPLESITNNLELLARCVESHLTDAELVVEHERLDSIRSGLRRVQGIVRRLDEMARKGVYETRDYLAGKKMADLAPRNEPEENGNAGAAVAKTANGCDWPLAGMSVLVLDDDLSVVSSLADVLRAERCLVHTATRPSAALGILRNVRVDAVISDVVMPEMDGYEFYMRVKEEMPELPVILMTAYYYDRDHIIKRSRMRGLEGALFKKPVNPAKLRELLVHVRHKAPLAKTAAATQA
ncbi:MAG TPA: PAS domain S-box protein [Candidatus Binataceae bacterium]|nr:PAS domain S-box protein [Candidatus Binataceae bacterium]